MRKTELLIPASSLEVLKIAVMFGADAVYIGGEAFGLRAKAKNFSTDDMREGIAFAHEHGVKVYVTANILAHNYDLEGAREYFKELKEIGPDALIIADPGMFTLAKEICPEIDVHISTQANTTNYKTAQETCVTVTLMKFFYQLTLLTGDPKYVDAFETSMYNAFFGSVNTNKVVEVSEPDWIKELEHIIEPMPFDSYSPLTAGTRGAVIGGLRLMSDKHYYGCCACIGSAGNGLIPKMALLTTEKGFALNLFIDGTVKSTTPEGKEITFETSTKYPVNANVKTTLHFNGSESFELLIRNPEWSKTTKLSVNGEEYMVNDGYITIQRAWADGDEIELVLDMRTEVIHPIPYGHEILMNKVIWGINYMVPTYDEEDPLAKKHIALRRGPLVLAQENRLGYSVDTPISVKINDDGYVDVTFPAKDIAPYEHIIEVCVPLDDGTKMHVTDYASAGKLWTNESKMAAWMLIK